MNYLLLFRTLLLVVLLAGVAMTGSAQELLPRDAAGWKPFAPRTKMAPVATPLAATDGYALKLSSDGKRYVYGGWRARVEPVEPGAWYHFRARAVPRNVDSLRESVTVQLRWKGGFGTEVAPSYVWEHRRTPDGALEFDRRVQAPPRTKAVEVELVLQWDADAEVTWDKVSLTRAEAPAPRRLKLAAVYFRPRGSRTPFESVEQNAEFLTRVATRHKPDVIVLGETINHAGAPGTFEEKAEPIPGPITELMGQLARRHSTYIAFGMVERDGNDVFNTAVLVDRQGRVAGKYRKVQLPFEELVNGVAPGDSFPVFQTEFGRVGMMICHDASFPEAARELALNGAELILVPIWGGRQPLVRARAQENGVWLATSGYDYDSEIIDPTGRVQAIAYHDRGPGVAVAEIDLNQEFPEAWIGNWRDTASKQARTSPYGKIRR